MPPIEGVAVKFGSQELIVPAMSLRIMFANDERIKSLQKTDQISISEYLRNAYPLILACLQRNYPDLTEEEFLEVADVDSLMEALSAIFGQSGFVPLIAGVQGSALPVPPSLGKNSSASSAEQQDGSPTTSSTG